MNNFAQKLKQSIFVKLGIILFLILLLVYPTAQIENLIYERQSIQQEAIYEVSSKWGAAQTITGPVLSIPYDKFDTTSQYDSKLGKKITIVNKSSEQAYLHVLPENLIIDGDISSEKRYRGIYEVVVYDSKVKLNGDFVLPDLSGHRIPVEHLHMDRAMLRVGITDLKGVENQMELNWAEAKSTFEPGTVCDDLFSSGVYSPVTIPENAFTENGGSGEPIRFALGMDLKGSEYLHFTPVGKTTTMAMHSDWPNPSFNGEFLPENRTVDASGFNADWKVLHLNRNFPQHWAGAGYSSSIYQSAFGVELFLPANNYQKSMRIAKYAILIISLTFLTFFFIEVLNKVIIHPVNYILIGGALVVFYTLLLSFSELMPYNLSYILAAGLTLALITLYTLAVIKSKKLSGLVGAF